MMLFDYLVVAITSYGVGLFSWKEKIECERMQQKYVRWWLDLERCTPGCVTLEETKRDNIRIRARQREVQYEERIRNATGMNILKECLRERQLKQRTFQRDGNT